MKYTILFLINFFLVLHLNAQEVNVLATASMIADMAQNITGDKIVVDCIVPIGGDPHIYEATAKDSRKIAKADLIFKNGLTFEGWLNELIANSGTKGKTIQVTDGVDVIQSLDYHNSSDPHAWMDVSNGLIYVKNIRDAIVELDPANEAIYEANYQTYKKKLEGLDQYIKNKISTIPKEKRVLITSHDAFQYYGKKYGIRLEAVIGTSTEAEVQTSDIARLNKIIKASKIPAVFVESTINPKLLKQLAKDNDIKIGGELFADSIGEEDGPAGSYYDMLKYNTDVIVAALNGDTVASAALEHEGHGEKESGNNYLVYGVLGVLLLGGLIFVFQKMS